MAAHTDTKGTVFTEPNDTDVVATRTYDAPRLLVWEAYTEPAHVTQWLLGPEGWTMPVCEIDLRPGGPWHWVWKGPNGREMEMHGEYREVIPPRRLVNTECWGEDWPETLNTLELAEDDGRTTVTSTVHYPSERARRKALATGMEDGWAQSDDRLARYLETLLEEAD